MTKKDYIVIAKAVQRSVGRFEARPNDSYVQNVRTGILEVVRSFISVACSDNPRFRITDFVSACGLEFDASGEVVFPSAKESA